MCALQLAVVSLLASTAIPAAAAAAASAVGAPAAVRHNVLLFVCDDLRPQLNKAYGHSEMVTPHFDAFTETALTFDWAFTNFAICSPSRNSFMTGRQPDHTRVWNFRQDFRQAGVGKTGLAGAEWVTMPEYFKQNGFLTLGHGKVRAATMCAHFPICVRAPLSVSPGEGVPGDACTTGRASPSSSLSHGVPRWVRRAR